MTYSFVKELLKNENIDWIIIAYGREKEFWNRLNRGEEGIQHKKNVEFHTLGKPNSLLEKVLLPAFFTIKILPIVRKRKPDMFVSLQPEHGVPTNTKVISFVPDVIPYKSGVFSQKSWLANKIKAINFSWAFNRIKKSEKVITHAKFTINDLVELGIEKENIEIVPLALTENFMQSITSQKNILDDKSCIRRTLSIYNLTKPYILYLGGLEKNKNVEQLINTFKIVSEKYPDLKLVIVGKEFKLGWDHKAVPMNERAIAIVKLATELKILHRINFTGFVEDQHMPFIIKNAECFVHLSTYEGFGLSVLEPQALGVPVIAADSSTYPEVLGDSAVLVDPYNPELIAEKIGQVLDSENLAHRKALIKKGFANTQRYDWEKSSLQILKIIENVSENTALLEQISKKNKSKKKETSVIELENNKVVIVASYFHPFRGGMEKVALDYALILKELGFEVHVITSKTKEGNVGGDDTEAYEGITIHRLKRIGSNYYLHYLVGLRGKLKEIAPRVIFQHSIGMILYDLNILSYKLFNRSNKSNKPIVINTPHGPFMSKNETGGRRLLQIAGTLFIRLYANFLYNHIFQVNPNQKKWLHSFYGIAEKKIQLFPPLTSEPKIKITAKKKLRDGRNEEGELDEIRITSLGRLDSYKGYEDVVAAFTEINSTINTKLTIAGAKDSFYNELHSLVKNSSRRDDITLLHDITDEERDEILKQTDIFILASEWEAFGIVIAEAMAWGAAIISTNTEGGKFLVKPNSNGLLFSYKDLPKLIQNINTLITNVPLMEKYQSESLKLVNSYTKSKIKVQLADFLDIIL